MKITEYLLRRFIESIDIKTLQIYLTLRTEYALTVNQGRCTVQYILFIEHSGYNVQWKRQGQKERLAFKTEKNLVHTVLMSILLHKTPLPLQLLETT